MPGVFSLILATLLLVWLKVTWLSGIISSGFFFIFIKYTRIMRLFNIAFILTVFVTILISCKKDKGDPNPPVVVFYAPNEGQHYNVGDTILVDFDVSDDKAINSVVVSFVDENLTSVLPQTPLQLFKGVTRYQVPIALSDVHLESGDYYIKVYATDGYNFKNFFRKVSLTALLDNTLGYYFVCDNSSNQKTIFFSDTLFAVSLFKNMSGDYGDALINSYNQTIAYCGAYTGDLQCMHLANGAVKWSVPYFSGINSYFKKLHKYKNITYVSLYSGAINGYNTDGAKVFGAQLNSLFYPDNILRMGNYVLIEAIEIAGSTRKIVMHSASTSGGIQEATLNEKVIAMYEKDSNNVYVLGNYNGQGSLKIYELSSNGFWSPKALPSGAITATVAVDKKTLLIAMDNGSIYKYDYSSNSLFLHINARATTMDFDRENQMVMVGFGKNVEWYSYANGALLNTYPASDSVRYVGVNNNK